MSRQELKPAHMPVQNYYAALPQQPHRINGALPSLSASTENDQGEATT